MRKKERLALEGVLRVLGMRELPGLNTREALLALNNRAFVGYPLSEADRIVIGNGSAIIMWHEAQQRAAISLLDELLGPESGSGSSQR